MALVPQKFREMVFQILYSQGFSSSETLETAIWLMGELKVPKSAALEAKAKAASIENCLETIDQKITAHSPDYTFERISSVEKTVLRLAMYELLFEVSLPKKVVLAEAMRLTRKFGTPESAQFVAAVLDAAFPEESLTPAASL